MKYAIYVSKTYDTQATIRRSSKSFGAGNYNFGR